MDILLDSSIVLLLALIQFWISVLLLYEFGSKEKCKESHLIDTFQETLSFRLLVLKVLKQFVVDDEFVNIFPEDSLTFLNLSLSEYTFAHAAGLSDNPAWCHI